MNVTLRNVHFYERMSDETNCFVATVYVDGKRRGEVRNEGHGGPNDYDFDTRDLEAYCKTLPGLKTEWREEPLEMDLDLLVGDLFDLWLKAKEFERLVKNRTVMKFKGDAEGDFQTVKVPFGPEVKARMLAKYGEKVEYFLNERTGF